MSLLISSFCVKLLLCVMLFIPAVGKSGCLAILWKKQPIGDPNPQ